MKYRTRIYYSEGQKALMGDRWQKGEGLKPDERGFLIFEQRLYFFEPMPEII